MQTRSSAAIGLPAVNQQASLGPKKLGRQRGLQPAVDHHQSRLAITGQQAHIELRIVFEHRADAGQQGAGTGPPGMTVGAGSLTGNPLALAILQSGAAVQRGSDFQAHPRTLAQHAAEKPEVELARGCRPGTYHHLDAGRAKVGKAAAGHARVRILKACHHPGDASMGQGLDAGASASPVRAGLQGDIGRGAAD